MDSGVGVLAGVAVLELALGVAVPVAGAALPVFGWAGPVLGRTGGACLTGDEIVPLVVVLAALVTGVSPHATGSGGSPISFFTLLHVNK